MDEEKREELATKVIIEKTAIASNFVCYEENLARKKRKNGSDLTEK